MVSGMGSFGPTPWLPGKGKVFSVGEQQRRVRTQRLLPRSQTVPQTGKFKGAPGRKEVHWLDSAAR